MKRMSAALLVLVVLFMVFGAVGAVGAPRAAAQDGDNESADSPGRVLVITTPRLTWATVERLRPPHLTEFFEGAAVAMASTRTSGSVTRPGDAYLTIGAGNRMATVANFDPTVVARTEPIPEGDPTAVYQRTTGVTATKPILAIGKPTIDNLNDDFYFGAEAGSLASALDDSGHSLAVIANADQQFGSPRFREAGLAAMDRNGQIDGGMVSSELLRANDQAAFGLELDPEVFTARFTSTWAEHDVVLVELSDLERAEMARAEATTRQGDAQFERALMTGDDLVGRMLDQVDLERDTVIVVSPTAPINDNQLTVFALAGRGVQAGWATSSTTRRDGYVTLTDIAPTILDQFGVDVPSAMGDTRLSGTADDATLADRVDHMVDRSERAVVRDKAFGPTTVTFILVLVVDIGLAMLCLARLPRLAGPVRGLALVVLAAMPVSYLLGFVRIGSPGALGAILAASSIVAAIAVSFTRRIDPGLPPLILIGALWAVLAVDIATGGNLQIDTIFGYSPLVAGRFAGFGNQAFSMIAVSSLLLASAFVERRHPDGAKVTLRTTAGVIVWFLVTIVLDGHPAMGSDVGGVLAIVPAATVAVLMFRGIRLNARLIALVGAGTLAVLGGFAALDLARPADSRTHLGRFMAKLFDGDAGEIIQRKIAANLRVLTSVWAWVIPVALVYFVYLTWRPNRTLQKLNTAHPHFRTFGVAALTLGVLAMGLNDSGVSLPAIMLATVAAYVSYLVIEIEHPVRRP